VKTIAVVGAGIMGTGIARVCAEAGLEVRLCSRRPETLEAARARMARNQAQMRAAGWWAFTGSTHLT
jgi:3-hydroxybutyryl-CoA dehydrogenase